MVNNGELNEKELGGKREAAGGEGGILLRCKVPAVACDHCKEFFFQFGFICIGNHVFKTH